MEIELVIIEICLFYLEQYYRFSMLQSNFHSTSQHPFHVSFPFQLGNIYFFCLLFSSYWHALQGQRSSTGELTHYTSSPHPPSPLRITPSDSSSPSPINPTPPYLWGASAYTPAGINTQEAAWNWEEGRGLTRERIVAGREWRIGRRLLKVGLRVDMNFSWGESVAVKGKQGGGGRGREEERLVEMKHQTLCKIRCMTLQVVKVQPAAFVNACH